MDPDDLERLRADHTEGAVRARLEGARSPGYLREAVYGAVDGTVTTFAVVAGAYGARLSPGVVLVLGAANLFGDGFSMAAGTFLAARAEREQREKALRTELEHIRLIPEGEREEVRQLLSQKGFEGEDLERALRVITADPHRWADMMIHEELGFPRAQVSPWRSGLATFAAFAAAGAVPLAAFAGGRAGLTLDPFFWSAALTAATFFAVGALKARFVEKSVTRSGLETLAVGGAAAAVAFLTGRLLRGLAG